MAALSALTVLAALYNARRWATQRRIVRMSRDPALRSLLPPVEAEPAGSFAPPQPPPDVRFERTPRFFARLPPRRRVTRERNVVGGPPLAILYLRVFDNRPRARTFARGAWREFGPVHLLRSAASVAPGELVRYRRAGRLDELFVSSPAQLARQLAEVPAEPQPPGLRWLPTIAGSSVLTFDRYGAYPVRSALCHGEFWTTALDELVARADLVVLDLSGYHRRFRGTQFELQRIVDTVPVGKVVLLADPFSSRRFLAEQVVLAWERMAAGSPNAGAGPRQVQGYVTDWYLDEVDERGAVLRRTLRASRTQSRWLLARTQQGLPVRTEPDRRGQRVIVGPPERDARVRPGLDSPPPKPDPVPPPRPGIRGRALAAAVVAVVVVVVVVAAAALYGLILAPDGIGATVVPGSGYHVRPNPSTARPEITALPPGAEVVVDCMQGNWARLREPIPGGYVYRDGLDLDGDPPTCGPG